MPLSTGTRLGPYEIVSPIGAGGMGEVYRARDPRMGRDVAIKLSAEHFSDRFEREVRAVAALNHANICQIYDVGPNYLVMELIEGPTLAERIKTGAVPLDEALAIGRQIGEALEAAHEKGIVHRDLKPANIKLKPDGTVKVLDFGLAKIAESTCAGSNPEESPTMPMGATRAGQIMGTAAYMAPEQARGRAVDKRADIWAFGVVLYEMVAGHKLFEGETISDILAGVLTKDPDWQRAPAKTRRLLKSCLQKDPKHRLRDIGDAWQLLEDASLPPARNRRPAWIVAGIATFGLAAALWAVWHLRQPVQTAQQSVLRLDIDLGAEVPITSSIIGPAVILSPDGGRLVFVSESADGSRRLFTRLLDQAKARMLSGTEGGYTPFFSPDGQWVGFFAGGKLKKTRLDGDEPVTLCDAPAGRGASWGEDGNIVAAIDTNGGLFQISSQSGKVVPLTELSPGENTHRWPQVLPGAEAAVFEASTSWGNYDEDSIAVVSLKKPHQRKILLEHAGMHPHYLSSGHLLYATKGSLVAVPFDLKRLEVKGAPTVLEEVSSQPTLGFAQADFSKEGTLVYRKGGAEGLRTIQWLDSAGQTRAIAGEPAFNLGLRLSPDGNLLAVHVAQGPSTDLWIYDWQRGSRTRLTNGMVTQYASWTPDGRFLVFYSPGGMFWTRADASGRAQQLTKSKRLQLPNCFTRDGKRLIFTEEITGGAEVRSVPIESGSGQLRAGESQSLLKLPAVNSFVSLSPDGRWLAYADAEGGRYEVNVRAFPDNGTKVQISTAGGSMPKWSRDGRSLFYRTEDQHIMVAAYTIQGQSLTPQKPRLWCPRPLANVGLALNFDLAADGKQFAALLPSESPAPRENQGRVRMIIHFADEVRRRAGVRSR